MADVFVFGMGKERLSLDLCLVCNRIDLLDFKNWTFKLVRTTAEALDLSYSKTSLRRLVDV